VEVALRVGAVEAVHQWVDVADAVALEAGLVGRYA
jgi:hypothetical protein